jgi:hypothetical protein
MEKVIMPLIQVKLMEQVFRLTQEKEIVSKLMDTVVLFEGENMFPFTWVSFEEICNLYGVLVGRPGPKVRRPPLPQATSKAKNTGGRYEHH